MIPIFYRPEMSHYQAAHPSSGKPDLVLADWQAHPGIAPHIRLEHFAPVEHALLHIAHDPAYVNAVLACKIENGFGNRSAAVAATLPYTVGSIVAACKHVFTSTENGDMSVAVSPTSGFHHAGHGFGGGFCTFNGLMVAAIRVHGLGLLEGKRILILDLDAHYGNGTQDIIDKLGIDYVDHITAVKSYNNASEAMRCANLYRHSKAWARGDYGLVIYQAGADIHIDDPLGGLLSTEAMGKRDADVFFACKARQLPLVWNLAGGYQRDRQGTLEPVLSLHRQTMLECVKRLLKD